MTVIHVELLDEGVQCWRPVEAERLLDGVYRITGERPNGETWAFNQGDSVHCRPQIMQGDTEPVLVAVELYRGQKG